MDDQLNKLTEDNINLNKICEEQEIKLDAFQKENSLLKEENSGAYKGRLYLEKKHVELENQLESLIKENEKLNRICHQRDSENQICAEKLDKMFDDNGRLYEEVSKLKAHLNLLSDQNRILEEELKIIKDQDQIIKSQLQRRDKINQIVNENNNRLGKGYV